MSILKRSSPAQKHLERLSKMSERQLIQLESEIGARLFGPVPKNHRREFFCLDDHSWIWHEEWIDEKGKKQLRTTRYEVRGKEVIKAQDGEKRVYVVGQELDNLLMAARLYYERVSREIYLCDPYTGKRQADILG